MSISPAPVRSELIREGIYCLGRFQTAQADLVAGWAPTPRDLFWLAPKTYPPLNAAKVIAWANEEACPMVLYRDDEPEPIGYVELNPMPGERTHLWMGHCVVACQMRGQGIARTMIRMLLRYGLEMRRAQRVSLVVFPDNLGAIRCYQACGFVSAGTQTKFFHPTGRHHTMIQMTIDADRWRACLNNGGELFHRR